MMDFSSLFYFIPLCSSRSLTPRADSCHCILILLIVLSLFFPRLFYKLFYCRLLKGLNYLYLNMQVLRVIYTSYLCFSRYLSVYYRFDSGFYLSFVTFTSLFIKIHVSLGIFLMYTERWPLLSSVSVYFISFMTFFIFQLVYTI